MRDIKFRAWNKIRECWENKLCLYLDDSKIGDVSDCFHNIENRENYILEQYTGLRDKKGKDIYEGDILETKEGQTEVLWCNDFCGFIPMVEKHCYLYGGEFENLTIIGNIHETPELLEK